MSDLRLPEVVVGVRDLHVFPDKHSAPILDVVDLSIRAGQRVAILGPSGAGKTTLLRVVNSAVTPSAGSVEVLGHRITPASGLPRAIRRRIGFIFQTFNLIDRSSVLANVLCGRLGFLGIASLLGIFPPRDRGLAMAALEEVGLSERVAQRADRLSGGEQQRVGIARALAQEPELILADEPVSNLDPELADDVLDLIGAASVRRGATLIMSLHQPDLARRYADRIIALRSGSVVFDGPPDELTAEQQARIYDRKRITPLPQGADQRA